MKKIFLKLGIITLGGLLLMGTISCNSSKKNAKNLEDSGLEENIIAAITAQVSTGKNAKEEVSILVGSTEYLVDVSQKNKNISTFATPECTTNQCSTERDLINKVCKQNGWPVGHSVLICKVDGYCCYCHCK